MRILVVSPSADPQSLAQSYIRSFRGLGHEAIGISVVGDATPSSTPVSLAWRGLLRIAPSLVSSSFRSRLRRAAADFRPHVTFVVRGVAVDSETLAFVKDHTERSLLWFDPDNLFVIGGESREVLECLPLYDALLHWNRRLLDRLQETAKRPADYLAFAADTGIHYPVRLKYNRDEIWRSDVMFAGKTTQDRVPYLVAASASARLAIYGSLCEDRCSRELVSSFRGKWICGEDYSKAVAGAGICLNILYHANLGAHNMRTFEILACGGFSLTMRSEGQLEFFEENSEMTCYSSVEELQDKIHYYLAHADQRHAIARRGLQAVQQHTYLHRAREVLNFAEQYRH